jgi:membrane protease subunit HflC
VRSSNRPFQVTEELEGIGAAEAMAKVETGRNGIAKIVLEKAAKITPQFGIELVDVRFKRLNYVESVQQKVFERMVSERNRIAERSRSEGQGRAAEISGQKERDVLGISSVGYKTAQEVKGDADAKAAAIYAKSYGRDPELYQFLKSMETLQGSVDDKTWLVLSTDSDLFRFLKRGGKGSE